MFEGSVGLSDENKCLIHTSWSSNDAWPYDWSNLCVSTVFQPSSNDELLQAVDLWVSDNATALETYGEIGGWDVSLITSMNQLFSGTIDNPSSFNDDISNWDVSNVTEMNSMFLRNNAFNQNISSWDVSNVTNMGATFYYASAFEGQMVFAECEKF